MILDHREVIIDVADQFDTARIGIVCFIDGSENVLDMPVPAGRDSRPSLGMIFTNLQIMTYVPPIQKFPSTLKSNMFGP